MILRNAKFGEGNTYNFRFLFVSSHLTRYSTFDEKWFELSIESARFLHGLVTKETSLTLTVCFGGNFSLVTQNSPKGVEDIKGGLSAGITVNHRCRYYRTLDI